MKVHDKFVIELAEVIKGYGNDYQVKDPAKLPCDYKFYEISGVAICEESFKKMKRLEDEINVVLDKIRAEIEQITDTMGVSYNQYVSKIDVLQIIDKYRAESEDMTREEQNVGMCQQDVGEMSEKQTDGDLISCEVVIEWLKGKDIIKLSSQEETARKELKALSSGKLKPCVENMPRTNGDLIAKIDKLPRIKVGNSNSPTVKYCIDEVLIHDLLENYKEEKTAINLNEHIKVKLTDYGKDIFYHQYDDLNKTYGKEIIKPRYPKVDNDGYTSFQLWCFMNLYGNYIDMGLQNVIEPLEIVFESAEKYGKEKEDE